MKEQNSRGTPQLGIGKQIILHLGPGWVAAGLLDGLKATTHHEVIPLLRQTAPMMETHILAQASLLGYYPKKE